jgi:hypothetical protein
MAVEADPALAETVRANAETVRARIADAGGDADRVTLLAVTKGFGPEAPAAALAAGLVDLGENYAQELVAKAEVVTGPPAPRWHFVGRLQRNKVRLLVPHVALWQSVDRVEVGAEIQKRAPGAAVLVQVNPAEEAQKGGCRPEDAAALVQALGDQGLDVRGLMAVAPDGPAHAVAAAFTLVVRLADELELPERSMGMTGDLEAAVRAGSTMVRVGRALFGPRPPR